MSEADAAVEDRIRALAAVLAAVRGRLFDLADEPDGGAPAAREDAEGGAGLRSVVSCVLADSLDPAIRDLLCAAEHEPSGSGAAGPAPPSPRAPEEPGYGALFSRLSANLPRVAAAVEREQREIEELFLDLTSLRREEWLPMTAEPRFHRLALVERLLDGAREELPSDPGAAGELAGLAAEVAGRLADADEGREGRARAACWMGQSLRIAGDLAGAERALSEATLYAAYSDEQAELCRALALLRWEQGRTDEARALLERAEELWAGEESPDEQGACQVLQGLLLVEEGKARDAVRLLRDGLPLLVDPWLAVYGGLALAFGLAEKGQAKKAREQRDESEGLVPLAPATAHLFALRLEAGIAASLGERNAAGAMLESLRREALERRWLPEAALATLDLARLDIENGREPDTAQRRLAELEGICAGPDALDGLLAALREYPAQIAAGESTKDVTASLAATLLRLLRRRGIHGGALPFT
ncbi:MAG TPA: hypothetical protein VIH93_16340 [Thermoanaerobaculia bacterium]